jgi:PE-PPE domain-containing protein
MSYRKLRWLGLGLVTTASAGVFGLSAMMNSASAHADDIGLVMGGSGLPIPGPQYVAAADELYLNNPLTGFYPGLTFYQATPTNPFGNGLFTPEGLYPLTGVHTLHLNYPENVNGLPDGSTSVGQGAAILESTILSNQAAGDASTVFGYSQSSTLSGIAMELLDPSGTPMTGPLDPQFLLVADPSNPNGGLLERFNGFETIGGPQSGTVDQLNLPSVGIAFDGATPSNDYVTNIYSLEYDGFTDFPRYPINFLADLNAFLGIQTLHGTYLNGGIDGSGPTPVQIADAILLPGSADSGTADSLTNYYMIDETAPLVAMLPKPLQELLGPDLTYLINLGYGDGSLGYSVTADSPANIPTPFGLFPDVSMSTVLNTLVTDTEEGFQNLATNTDPFTAAVEPALSGQSIADVWSALAVDAANPAASFTDFVNALSSAASTLYSTLLPTADVINMLVTSVPAWETSIFADTLSTGDLVDAFGLPIAATTALDTLAAGFEVNILTDAFSQIAADFQGLI